MSQRSRGRRIPPGTGPSTFDAANGNWYRTLDATWQRGDRRSRPRLDPPDPQHAVVYFRYARGYKSGGFSTYTIAPLPETNPEYLDSFEIGGKKTVGSTFSLNGAAFYYHYTNDQVPLTCRTEFGASSYSDNSPLVHTYGVELEGVWRPIDHLTFSLNYSYLHATIANDGGCIQDIVDPAATLPGSNTAGCPAGSGTQHINGEYLPEAPKNKSRSTRSTRSILNRVT